MMEQTPPSQAALSSFTENATVASDLAVRAGGEQVDAALDPSRAALSVEHVADANRRYPGERVTLYTRVNIKSAVAGFSVRVQMPAGLEIDTYSSNNAGLMPLFLSVMEAGARELVMLPGPNGDPFPVRIPNQPTRAIEPTRMAQDMIWRVMEPQEAGAQHEFAVTCVVLPVHKDAMLHSTAFLSVVDGQNSTENSTENGGVSEVQVSTAAATIAIYRAGSYLEYLPSLYEEDSFMGRFLMLFESFWRPIDQQISGIHNYFDPDLTPARFLPWLASWFDLALDEFWSESQQRELLNSVMWLYRRRGTRVALQRYLEIFTQHPVEILEKRAKNMTLGNKARLGVGVALGTSNMPHTFTVKLQLNEITPPDGMDAERATREIARLEKQRLALIHRMILSEKPAHTSYRLEIIPVTDQVTG
jgi:phage tail-like protein